MKRCTLLAKRCTLLAKRCTLLAKRCTLLAKRCTLLTKRCTLLTKRCTLLTKRCTLLTSAFAFLLIFPQLPSYAGPDKAGPAWANALNLRCRPFGQVRFEKAITLGVEIYAEEKAKALYITETGALAVGRLGKISERKVGDPFWLYGFGLKVRPSGFEPPLKSFGFEVYRDEHNGHCLYIAETGAVAVVPGAADFRPLRETKGAAWLHALDLQTRKSAGRAFDRDTKTWGGEVFQDENNTHLIYLSDSGMFAVVPSGKESPGPTMKVKPTHWLYSSDAKVAKAGALRDDFVTFHVKVYRDEIHGNLIYVVDSGSLSVVASKETMPVIKKPDPFKLLRQMSLKCRPAREASFESFSFGVSVFADLNSGCNVYLSDKGHIVAIAD